MPGGSTGGTGGTNDGNGKTNDSSSPPLPAQFDTGGNWIVYVARLEQYFVAYNIDDANRKRAILLTSLAEDVYSRLMDLCFPDLPETKSFKEISEILKKHCQPAVSVYAERRAFYDAKQNENESVADFIARLKGLTRYCKFGDSYKDVLRDKFVCGLLWGPLFNKAMELEPTATLEACVEAAIRKEIFLKQMQSSSTEATESVCYMNGNKPCYTCGETNHNSQSCKFKSYVCRSCNVKGHLARVCKKKPQKDIGHHFVELDQLDQRIVDTIEREKNSNPYPDDDERLTYR